MTEPAAKIAAVMDVVTDSCAWCGNLIDEDETFGLKTRFHKRIELEVDEERCVPISIVHLDLQVPGVVRRNGCRPAWTGLDLTFQTCSQGCAKTLMAALQIERLLFTVPQYG